MKSPNVWDKTAVRSAGNEDPEAHCNRCTRLVTATVILRSTAPPSSDAGLQTEVGKGEGTATPRLTNSGRHR